MAPSSHLCIESTKFSTIDRGHQIDCSSGRALCGRQESKRSGLRDGLCPVVRLEFGVDIPCVRLDRVERNEKLIPHIPIAETITDELKQFDFALAQRFWEIRLVDLVRRLMFLFRINHRTDASSFCKYTGEMPRAVAS